MKRLALAILAFAIITFAAAQNYYTTTFPATENPISEGGNWVNGLNPGVHWGDMQTFAGGHIGGTNVNSGCSGATPNNCNDSVASLTGTWTADQAACATVFIGTISRTALDELEIHLHQTTTAGNSTGYEFNYSTQNAGGQYMQIVRWDGFSGGLLHFTVLGGSSGVPVGLNNGDLFCASAVAGNLKSWVLRAGSVIATAPASPITDTTYTGGAPGLGTFNGNGPLSDNAQFGFSSFTAANLYARTVSQSDIQAVLSGSLHVATNGESLAIPPGQATITNGLTIPAGVGIQIIGAGSVPTASCAAGGPGTCLTLTETSNITGIPMSPAAASATTRLSSITWIPSVPYCTGTALACGNGGGVNGPISVNGTCNSGGCPNLRLDNNFVSSKWAANGISDDTFANVTNMFGVADHNTIEDVAPASNGVDFINVGHGQWLGVSQYGDNSFATADTFGTLQAFYLEDNIFGGHAIGTDTDVNGVNGGGGRFVCRFNSWPSGISTGGGCTGHGTDTTQRVRGVRQWEAYWNTGVCTNNTQGCGSVWPGRSGVGMSFANTFTNLAGCTFNGVPQPCFLKGLATIDTQRRWRADIPWGGADGSQPWDTNDSTLGGGTGIAFSGTILTAATGGPGWTITVSGTPWTVNQWVSLGTPFNIRDTVANGGAEIQSNTTNSLTIIVPDTGHGTAFAAGHGFQIRRVLVAMDQSTRGAGVLLNGNLTSPAPVGPVNEVLDPTYEADDNLPSTASATIGANTASIIQNRDFFVETTRQAANNSCGGVSCTPFNGTSGSGHGLFANKPNCTSGPACLTGVGYWATDCPGATGCTGTPWNTSGNGANGELFTWNGSAWVLYFKPFTYPHPLVTGTASAGTVSVSPLTENFGSVVTGGFSSAQTATLTNTTASSITVSPVTKTGANPSQFSIGADNCSGATVVANGGQCSVTTQFAPTSTGALSANLSIVTSGGSFTVAMSGTGTSPTNPGVSISPASISFGNISVGASSAANVVTITSTTSANLVMGTPPATITGAGFSLVAVGGQCTNGQSIPQSSTCKESVVFTPSVTGSVSGSLSIFNNVTGSPQVVPLTGTGVGTIAVNPVSLNFGTIAQGQTSTAQPVTITNNTGITITLIGTTFTNLDFAGSGCSTGTLTNGQNCTASITFRPSATTGTNETGFLLVNFTGVGGSPVSVPLAGTVLAPIGTPATNIFATNLAGCGAIPKLTTFCFTKDGHIYVGVCNPTCLSFQPLKMNVTGSAQ